MLSGRGVLELADEEADVLEIEVPLGVGDQLDGQLVDAGIARERSLGELGQLGVVAARQVLADLDDVFLDHVEIVQEPVAGGADVHAPIGGVGERRAGFLQQPFGVVEAAEQRAGDDLRAEMGGAAGRRLGDALAQRERPRVRREAFGAEQLAAERADAALVGEGPAAESGFSAGWEYCRQSARLAFRVNGF